MSLILFSFPFFSFGKKRRQHSLAIFCKSLRKLWPRRTTYSQHIHRHHFLPEASKSKPFHYVLLSVGYFCSLISSINTNFTIILKYWKHHFCFRFFLYVMPQISVSWQLHFVDLGRGMCLLAFITTWHNHKHLGRGSLVLKNSSCLWWSVLIETAVRESIPVSAASPLGR